MEKKVTISDIAREVGVSKTTISRYLNGNYGYMSAETRQRIENVIEEKGYVPNSIARTLKTKKSRLIGIIANTLRYQVAAQTITAIQDVCIQHGYGTIVYRSNGDSREESNVIQLCLNQQVEGFIIIPCENSTERYVELCERGIPVVLCSRYLMDWPYGCVYVKHRELIWAMMDHLREQGFESATASFELSFPQLRDLRKYLPTAALVYGRLPLMIFRNCAVKTQLSRCACHEGRVLTDRRGARFPVRKAFGCRNELLNSQPLYLADRLEDLRGLGLSEARLLFTTESPEEVLRVFTAYQTGAPAPEQFTRGLYTRGVE